MIITNKYLSTCKINQIKNPIFNKKNWKKPWKYKYNKF